MNADDAPRWHRTSPLAAVFYLGRIWQLIAKNALQSLAPLAAFMVAFGGDPMTRLAIGASAMILFTIVVAVLRYWAFRYSIHGDAVLIREGVFHKKQLDIRFERVQAVNTTRGVLDRLFGLVNVRFDTAGSSGHEGELPAVPLPLAARLRDAIDRTPKTEEAATEEVVEAAARRLIRLGPADMVRIGVSSGRVFLILAVLGPLSEALDLELHERIEESAVLEAVGAAGIAAMPGPALWFAVALALLLLLMAGAVVAAFLRYHRFELSAEPTVLRSTAGLFTRYEDRIDRKKIQSLRVTQNLVLRLLARYRLRMRQVTGGRGGAQALVVPICTTEELPLIEQEVFGEEFRGLTLDPQAQAFEKVSPYYLRSRIVMFGILPALAGLLLLLPATGAAALATLLWIPLVAVVTWQVYRRLGVRVTKDGLALRSGFLGFRLHAHLHRKVQKVSVVQSPFQRRRGLGTLHVHVAAGSVKVPFVDLAAAERLKDFILWRVESSRRTWH